MMDFGLFSLLLVAIAIGFLLGWRARGKRAHSENQRSSQGYFRGLNYLLNEQADGAMDAFIDALEVTPETLETHLALGNLLRRKGEITKATKIHQNLLARPSLTTLQLHGAQLELARDFIKAGLLDRAEGLLQELVEANSQYKSEALEHLVEIYQDEREWAKAIHVANQLSHRRFGKSAHGRGRARAHFCCELAEQALAKKDVINARRYLRQALSYDKQSVRASLLWGGMEYQLGNYREALKLLQKVPVQNPNMIIESLDLVCDCYDKLGDKRGLHRYLQELLTHYPSSTLVIRIAEEIRWAEGDHAAADFIAQQLRQRPTIKALIRLIELHLLRSDGRATENLLLLKQLMERVLEAKPDYSCGQCGFTGNQLHWLCPGCKSWGTITAIIGVEGE